MPTPRDPANPERPETLILDDTDAQTLRAIIGNLIDYNGMILTDGDWMMCQVCKARANRTGSQRSIVHRPTCLVTKARELAPQLGIEALTWSEGN